MGIEWDYLGFNHGVLALLSGVLQSIIYDMATRHANRILFL